MFDIFLGFRMRIGRLAFFLAGLGLSFAVVIIAYTVFGLLLRTTDYSPNTFIPAIIICAGGTLWAVCNLYAMRVRDLGWDPALVIPLWLLLSAIDFMVAYLFPEFAIRADDTGTWVGRIANTLFWLTLQFWPGTPGGYIAQANAESETVVDRGAIRSGKPDLAAPPSRFDKPARRSSFGRLSQ